jgi:hypothetical protein
MHVSRLVSLFAGALALVVVASVATISSANTAAKSTASTQSSSHHATSTAPAHSSTPAASASAGDAHLATVRKNLEESSHNLRAYHWKETVAVSLKGEDKSTMISSVAYNATGKIVRTPEPVPANSQMNGVRGATPNAEKAELQSYAHGAIALLREYIPADPSRLRKEAGKMTSSIDGDRTRLMFKDYQKPGDQVTFELNPSNQITSISVNSYMATARDVVTMNADMSNLADGTTYPSRIRVDTPAKNMGLTVTNSDFQKKTS